MRRGVLPRTWNPKHHPAHFLDRDVSFWESHSFSVQALLFDPFQKSHQTTRAEKWKRLVLDSLQGPTFHLCASWISEQHCEQKDPGKNKINIKIKTPHPFVGTGSWERASHFFHVGRNGVARAPLSASQVFERQRPEPLHPLSPGESRFVPLAFGTCVDLAKGADVSGPLLGASWVVFTRTPYLFCWVRLENCRFQERPLRELPFLVGWFHPIETNSDSRAGKLASNHYSRNHEIQIFGGGFFSPILCTHCCEPNNTYLEGRMKSKIPGWFQAF